MSENDYPLEECPDCLVSMSPESGINQIAKKRDEARARVAALEQANAQAMLEIIGENLQQKVRLDLFEDLTRNFVWLLDHREEAAWGRWKDVEQQARKRAKEIMPDAEP